MLTNLVRDLDDHDLSVLHTRNTQNVLVGVACVNPLQKKFARGSIYSEGSVANDRRGFEWNIEQVVTG